MTHVNLRKDWKRKGAAGKLPPMEKIVRVFHGFPSSEEADRQYYLSLSPEQRLDLLLELVQQGQPDETEQGFERVYRITQLQRG